MVVVARGVVVEPEITEGDVVLKEEVDDEDDVVDDERVVLVVLALVVDNVVVVVVVEEVSPQGNSRLDESKNGVATVPKAAGDNRALRNTVISVPVD